MDSKIIAAIIIAVGFVGGMYLYTENNPYNLCLKAQENHSLVAGSTKKEAKDDAMYACIDYSK